MDKANKATKRAGAAAVNKQLDPDEETTSLLHDVEDPAAKTFKKVGNIENGYFCKINLI